MLLLTLGQQRVVEALGKLEKKASPQWQREVSSELPIYLTRAPVIRVPITERLKEDLFLVLAHLQM
jgi:hypothetical protein